MNIFSLPTDALSLRGDSFYRMLEQFCGEQLVGLLQLQFIDNSLDLIDAIDPFFILQLESDRTNSIKESLGVSHTDEQGSYSFFVLPGLRLKLEKLIRSLRNFDTSITQSSDRSKSITISTKLIEKYPFLSDLIYCLESNLLTDFSIDFLTNWISNVTRPSKNSFRYSRSIKDFAVSVYILGGPTLYEFLRLNIMGSIPNITSIHSLLSASKYKFIEGEFQYSRFVESVRPLGCKYAFCGEDCTVVIRKVSYDSHSNSFVGFTLPLENGFPSRQFYSTNSFNQLEHWHNEVDKSSFLNAHVIQGLTSQDQVACTPFLLSAYGTNSKYNSYDVLSRWSRIFDVLMAENIRILGFSTDGDPKNLRAMRNSMGFFTNNKTIFLNHPDIFKISSLKTNSWFFIRPEQLFVCFQDAIHLCGNLRNRLLSSDVFLLIGDQVASVDHLLDLIENQSKLDHGLVLSDIYVKDKQNYASCEKITNDNVLNCLKRISTSAATQVYVQIMRFVRLAYVEKHVSIIDRLFTAWTAVFIVRIWSAFLEKTSIGDIQQTLSTQFPTKSFDSIKKRNLFISMPTLFSLELNAHSLTYLLVLVAEKQITMDALQIIFNSQACESYFRWARSMSGVFSSIVNFTVLDFLHRASKLSALQEVKFAAEQNLNKLVFPKHHKLWKQTSQSSSTLTTTTITEKIIEDTVHSAYLEANRILSDCKLSILDPLDQMISFDEVNRFAFERLSRSRQKTSNTQSFQWSSTGQVSDDDNDDDDDENENDVSINLNTRFDDNYDTDYDDSSTGFDDSDPGIIPNVTNAAIHGIRIVDSIDENHSDLYFRVNINNQDKFMHKQSATWYFSKDRVRLSTDRWKRVQSRQ